MGDVAMTVPVIRLVRKHSPGIKISILTKPIYQKIFREIEDINLNKKFFYAFDGDGLRYEIAEFSNCIRQSQQESHLLSLEDSFQIIKIIENFNNQKNIAMLNKV